MRKNRKQQINNCKMSSQSPSPTLTFRSKRKCCCKVADLTAMAALTYCVFLAVVFVQGAQAGVIKKREIPFAIDLTPDMVTTTASTVAVVTTIRPVMHDPDIEERESSKTAETTTLPPPPTIAANLAETQTNDSVLATRLALQPAMPQGGSVTESSSKEYMLNEIALNETKKLAKSLNEDLEANKQETEIANKTVLVANNGLGTVNPAPNPGVQGDFDSELDLKAVNTITHESSREPRLDETYNETQTRSETILTNTEAGIRAVGNDVAVRNILEKVSNNDRTEQQPGSHEMGNGISMAGFEENHNDQKTKDTLSENLPVKERPEDKEIHTELGTSSEKSEPGSNTLKEQTSNENLSDREKTEGKEIPFTTKSELGNAIALKTESNSLNEQSSKENLQVKVKVLETSTGNAEIQFKEESLKENHENLQEYQNNLKISQINTDPTKDTEFNEQISKENLLPKIGNQQNHNETSIKSELENVKTVNTEWNSTHAESSKENIVLKAGNEEIHQDGNTNENNLAKTNTFTLKENQTAIATDPPTITVKDESLETNHISEQKKTTTEINLQNQNQTIFSINSEKSHVNSEGDSQLNKTESSSGLHIQDGLDKTVWKDITNDLPEKTTEKIPKENATLDQNKLEYGRSMFKNAEESETEEAFTENSHIANNIDFGDATTSSNNNYSGERGKKPKFINDNSTNAQQMNLPNNAEVWSLAGMKNLPIFNNTMETEPKHTTEGRELEELGKAKQTGEQLEIPVNKTNLNSPQSEKFLLDWSHIIMDKELVATTAIYEDQQDNNEVNQKLKPEEVDTMSKLNGNPTTLEQENTTNNSMLENLPSNEFSGSTTTTSPPITANSSTTILSAMSDNVVNVEGDKQKPPTTDSFNNEREMALKEIEFVGGHQDTSTLSSFSSSSAEIVASPKSVVTHEQLQRPDDTNEINLTLNNNKTTTAGADFAVGEQSNKSVTNLTEIETQTKTERVIVLTTPTAVIEEPNANTTAEPFSTLETGNENVTAKVAASPTGLEKSQNVKENLENQNESTATDITITTYRPTFWGPITPASPASSSSTPNPLKTNSDTPILQTAITTEKIPLAEVIDQNGNNEIEQKQSINVETTTAAATTTISSETVGFNNFSSTIKTHLNEQVLLETTTELITTTTAVDILLMTTAAAAETTTTNETLSEKTTSSSKDEIIKQGKEEIHFNETITTEATTTPKNEELLVNEQKEQVAETTTETVIIIGSTTSSTTTSTRPPETETEKSEKEQQEIETTTKAIEADETPVVNKTQEGSKLTSSNNESFFTTTGLPILTTIASKTKDNEEQTQEEEEEEETTTKAVDTYFKFPVKGKGGASRKETEIITTTTATTTAATADATTIEEDDRELETTTTNMSLIPPPTTTETTITTTNKEETYISLLDDSTTTTTTNAPNTTTAANGEIPTTPSPPLTITTTTSKNIDISSKIEEIYKVIVSSSTEADTAATTTTEAIPPTTTTPQGLLTTTTTRTFFNETTTTAANMIPTTTASPNVIPADIGSKTTLPPPINSIMVGNSGNIYPKNTEASSEGTDVNVIIAITVSIIGVIALILLVAFLYLMRKRQKQTSYSQRCRPVSLDEYAIDNGSIGGSIRKGSALRSSKRTYGNLAFDDPSIRHNAMGVHELAKFSSEKLRIFEEFRDVPQITAREDEVPQGCEDKNRYANVLPLPETRVVLQRLNDDDKTEYINANYVTGPKDAPNYYIACQAPLDSTVEDFWRMLWEQQSRVIIQATDLIENGVEKCAEYLPPSVTLDNHSTFGDFQVTLQNREVKDKYAISTLILKHTGENNATRELTHFWYKWPETGVPVEEAPIIAMLLEARSSLISYAIEQANEDKENSLGGATLKSAEEGTAAPITTTNGSSGKEGGNVNGEINGNISMVAIKKTARNQGPLTIHCSPGTGRTGTIIACDIALRSLETPKRTVDIPHIVYYVRRGRASAVLTKEQYEFIYKVANMYAAKISNPTNYN